MKHLLYCSFYLQLLNLIFGKSLFLPTRNELMKTVRASEVTVAKRSAKMRVNPEERGGYFEGDIRLTPRNFARTGLVRSSAKWPGGIVPYDIDFDKFSNRQVDVIFDAMYQFNKYTCVRFERRQGEHDYVYIQEKRAGCNSDLGRKGGRQIVNLERWGCFDKIGRTIHELMHTLGFVHEHSRPDRDDYVDIFYENIVDDDDYNNIHWYFNKYTTDYVQTFGVPYDYGSIMHYEKYAFSKKGEPTIVPKKKGVYIGQRKRLSEKDILKVNKMYNCKK